MNVMYFKLGLSGLLALSTLTLTACTDEQLAFGAGAVVGAVVVGDHGHHRHRPPPPRYRERGRRPHYLQSAQINVDITDEALASDEVQAAAFHFQIPIEAADYILTALKAAEQKDFSKLDELGIYREDITAMAMGANPSSSSLVSVSQKLNLGLGETHNVFQQIKIDIDQAM
jgi:hypothetical protein